MRIQSGKTDQIVYFWAESTTGGAKTGLSSFTVYRSRRGGVATAYTTPTVAEISSANMPGLYALTVDEDTSVDPGSLTEDYALYITATGMIPKRISLELFQVNAIRSNTAQAGAASAVTLDASASATDNFYRGLRIVITGGTGIGQVRRIASYIGSTKVATVGQAWATVPDNTSTFTILPDAGVNVEAWLLSVPNTLTAGLVDTNVVDWKGATAPAMTGDAYARLGAPVGASVSADVAAVNAKTTNLPSDPADQSLIIAATNALASQISGLNNLSQGNIRNALGMASANLDTQIAALPTADENADALLDRADAIEDDLSLRGALRVMSAVLVGKATGLLGPSADFWSADDAKVRVTATLNTGTGARGVPTLDPD